MMNEKDARDYVKSHSHSCPNCGSALIIRWFGPANLRARLESVFSGSVGVRTELSAVETAEERLRSGASEQLRSNGPW